MTAPESLADWVWLARIRRPQGRKGEVFAELLTDFPEKFAERRQLWLLPAVASAGGQDLSHLQTRGEGAGKATSAQSKPRSVQLISHWRHKGGIVLHFAGIDSISAAEALKDLIVTVPRAERTELSEDAAYISDLIGCTLSDVAGSDPMTIGTIEDVDLTAGPVPLLVVRSPRGEVLVPFAKSYLRRIDTAARRVEMTLPEGLVSLNEPG
jgi:16S rRNA processing protein RimM